MFCVGEKGGLQLVDFLKSPLTASIVKRFNEENLKSTLKKKVCVNAPWMVVY